MFLKEKVDGLSPQGIKSENFLKDFPLMNSSVSYVKVMSRGFRTALARTVFNLTNCCSGSA